MTTTPEEEPDVLPSSDPEPLQTPDPDNPDHPHGKDATLSGPTQRPDDAGSTADAPS